MTYASFCTEDVAKRLIFLPFEMAPEHLIDSRDVQAAIRRIQAASASLDNSIYCVQMDLFGVVSSKMELATIDV